MTVVLLDDDNDPLEVLHDGICYTFIELHHNGDGWWFSDGGEGDPLHPKGWVKAYNMTFGKDPLDKEIIEAYEDFDQW